MISKLATYTNLNNHFTPGRNGKTVDTITIHCTASASEFVTAKSICDYFAKTDRESSPNYAVGGDGTIACCVDEENRSWCTGGTKTVCGETGSMNDYHAITIETASNLSGSIVTPKAIEATIKLCVDICRRYGKTKAIWFGDNAEKMISYKAKPNEMKFTWHRWFAKKACPGSAIMGEMGYIIDSINKALSSDTKTPEKPVVLYRLQLGAFVSKKYAERLRDDVRKTIAPDAFITKVGDYYKVQVGAYSVYKNAVEMRQVCRDAGYKDAWITEIEINKPVGKSVDELAAEVIAGKWGRGSERREKLTAAGYDYDAVQKIVNKIMEG